MFEAVSIILDLLISLVEFVGLCLKFITVAGKPSDDLAPGTLNSILKQAGLKE
ncbi:type II toxin-antitoxin system HicA family toxin [Methylomonas sp. EFPC3]|uniref:type II toxin-antitoxin system HicA family toxin n=1 Tax=Methylomonas sp. EFPC3 TaxID=3021710 RepID=UPI0024160819|nr:type II toxin-antitoxin system HicA family toxin [Methylomonas sp. EFPC3]WFP49490.1 type II toxin-antitoxin system HicA family toxin [Methylomonas sp. EFPC3]